MGRRPAGAGVQEVPQERVGGEDLGVEFDAPAARVAQDQPRGHAVGGPYESEHVGPYPPLAQQTAYGQPVVARAHARREEHDEEQQGDPRPAARAGGVEAAAGEVDEDEQRAERAGAVDGGAQVARPAPVGDGGIAGPAQGRGALRAAPLLPCRTELSSPSHAGTVDPRPPPVRRR